MKVGAYLAAYSESLELVEPGEGPFDDPAGLAQAGAMGCALAGDLRSWPPNRTGTGSCSQTSCAVCSVTVPSLMYRVPPRAHGALPAIAARQWKRRLYADLAEQPVPGAIEGVGRRLLSMVT